MVEVILTGSPRTGTTALTELLCHDEKVFVTNEADTYNVDPSNWRSVVTAAYNAPRSVLKRWLDRKGFTLTEMLAKGPRGWIRQQAARGFAVYGDKTPTYVYDLERILKQNPRVRLVLTVRDCRDVVSSSVTARKKAGDQADAWMHDSIQDAAAMWTAAARNMMRVIDWMPAAHFIILKYEDAVLHPQTTLRRLSELFEYDIQIANPAGGYQATNIGRWREDLPDVVRDLPSEALRCMEYFGYDWMAPPTSWVFSGPVEEQGWRPTEGLAPAADGRLRTLASRSMLESPHIEVRLSEVGAVALALAVEPASQGETGEMEVRVYPRFAGHGNYSREYALVHRVPVDGKPREFAIEVPEGLRATDQMVEQFAVEFVGDGPLVSLHRVVLRKRSA